jgi:type I restriction-modification system DNA methylase subunit
MKQSNRQSYKGQSWKNIEKIIREGYDRGNVFHDWLDLMLYAYLSLTDNFKRGNNDFGKFNGEWEKKYMEIVGRYKKSEIDLFADAHTELVKEIITTGEDCLGEIYEKEITYGEHGQFFTPLSICDFMANISNVKDGERVYDPACGSGRLLLSAAKLNPRAIFYGTDLDQRCAKMTVLNLIFRGLKGKVQWGNSLTFEIFKEWYIQGGLVEQNDNPPKQEIKSKEKHQQVLI